LTTHVASRRCLQATLRAADSHLGAREQGQLPKARY
jgi:hypothetical protein